MAVSKWSNVLLNLFTSVEATADDVFVLSVRGGAPADVSDWPLWTGDELAVLLVNILVYPRTVIYVLLVILGVFMNVNRLPIYSHIVT